MDTKESVGKAAKGLGSLVLILLLMKGFTFSFRSKLAVNYRNHCRRNTLFILCGLAMYCRIFMEKEVGDNRRNFYRLLLCVYCQ